MDADDCPFDGQIPLKRPEQPTAPQPASESILQRIINSPLDSLKFGDYAKLKSGRDRFSAMSQMELEAEMSDMDWRFVAAAFPVDLSAQASCFRWILRGLDCDKAIRKVSADLTISENATRGKR